jgi:hypothetical protein
MTIDRLIFLALVAAAAPLAAQQQAASAPSAARLSRDDIAAYARVQVAITTAHDSINKRLAKSGNKTAKAQLQLQDSLRAQVAEILHHNGMSEAEYQRRTYLVSTDTSTRRLFDSVVVVLTGAPLPGQVLRGMQLPVPAGPVGVHLAHVVNGFTDTPGLQGLLPTATGEARIAAQHAALAARQPQNLDYMKLHAGHVIHALDPTVINMGPGLGYGLRKAAAAVATHVELAVAQPGPSQNVTAHSKHVVIAAKNTIQRADQLLALAQKVQAAATAAEAAALVSQMASLAEQLMPGADANGDGRITYEVNEGGLQHAEEHFRFMLRP